HSPRVPAARFRALLAGRSEHPARQRGDRARPGNQPEIHGIAWRFAGDRQRGGAGNAGDDAPAGPPGYRGLTGRRHPCAGPSRRGKIRLSEAMRVGSMSRPTRTGRRLSIQHLAIPALLLLPLAVSGCDSAREAMGLNKKSPDEFAVVTRAPLVLPPEFGLRPPQPGAPR